MKNFLSIILAFAFFSLTVESSIYGAVCQDEDEEARIVKDIQIQYQELNRRFNSARDRLSDITQKIGHADDKVVVNDLIDLAAEIDNVTAAVKGPMVPQQAAGFAAFRAEIFRQIDRILETHKTADSELSGTLENSWTLLHRWNQLIATTVKKGSDADEKAKEFLKDVKTYFEKATTPEDIVIESFLLRSVIQRSTASQKVPPLFSRAVQNTAVEIAVDHRVASVVPLLVAELNDRVSIKPVSTSADGLVGPGGRQIPGLEQRLQSILSLLRDRQKFLQSPESKEKTARQLVFRSISLRALRDLSAGHPQASVRMESKDVVQLMEDK